MPHIEEHTDESVNGSSCPHTALTQRWDNPSDMGNKEKATYTCEACGATFNYEEAQGFMQHPNVGAVAKADEAAEQAETPAEPVPGA